MPAEAVGIRKTVAPFMRFVSKSLTLTRNVAVVRHHRGRPCRHRRSSTGAASSEALSTTQPKAVASWGPASLLAVGLACGIGSVALFKRFAKRPSHAVDHSSGSSSMHTSSPVVDDWMHVFADANRLIKVGSPRQILGSSPVTKNLIRQDNLFDKMMEVEMVKEIHFFYDPSRKEFHSVVHLGKEVCGFPNTVHGGLTAAIVDETFGGLMFNIWRTGGLGLSLPAVTSRLEVDYRNRLPQNATIICTTSVDGEREGRSLWMTAELKDSEKDITYATARACFVSPSWTRSAVKWIKGTLLSSS